MAQKMYPLTECALCGGIEILQRHHKDGNPSNNSRENVQVLCQKCHTATHMETDTWGKGKVKMAQCVVCNTTFQPKRTRNKKLCRKPECLREWGRRAAMKRWSSRELQMVSQTA